jgi:c-di-GMP-binding flagellar brake protein YcgR
MSDNAKFILKNPTEITRKLNLILKQDCLITVSFNKGKSFFLSTLLDIDTKKKKMNLDFASEEQLNKQILKATPITLTTNVGGVAVTFILEKVSKPLLSHHNAFILDFPEELMWRERRSFYRIKTPLQNTPNCKFILNTHDEAGNDLSYNLKIDLLDLSLTGTSFTYDPKLYKSDIFEGIKEIPSCSIMLPGIGRFSTVLQVRNQRPQKISAPEQAQIIGVKFHKLSGAIESQIQRYLLSIERSRI